MKPAIVACAWVIACLQLVQGQQPAAQQPAVLEPAVLAYVVAPQFERFDTKFGQALKLVELSLPNPKLLVQMSGVHQGFNPRGGMALLVVQAAEATTAPRLCLRAATDDYAQFVRSLGGDPGEKTAAVRIGGQPLVAGRSGDSALLMDVAARPVLEEMLHRNTRSHELPAEWRSWIDQQHVAVVVTPQGLARIRSAIDALPDRSEVRDRIPDAELFQDEPEFEIDADRNASTEQESRVTADADPFARNWNRFVQQFVGAIDQHPVARAIASHVDVAALGVRISDEGDVVCQLRLGWRDDSSLHGMESPETFAVPTSLFKEPFVVSGGGTLPRPIVDMLAAGYAESFAQFFDRTRYRDEDLRSLKYAARVAAGEVSGIALLQRPADTTVGVQTNQFVMLKCDDADAAMNEIASVIKSWNWLMDNAEGEVLQLGSKPQQLRGKRAISYEADMAAAFSPRGPDGTPQVLPEVRTAMEELFGKGGAFRLLVVRLDDHTVLLAGGSAEQAEQLMAELDAETVAVDRPPVERLLAAPGRFRIFVDARQYSQWLKNTRYAGMGEVIGGPLVRIFPQTPAVAVAVGADKDGMLIELVGLPDTVRGIGAYLKP
jgi:hypothetical protein